MDILRLIVSTREEQGASKQALDANGGVDCQFCTCRGMMSLQVQLLIGTSAIPHGRSPLSTREEIRTFLTSPLQLRSGGSLHKCRLKDTRLDKEYPEHPWHITQIIRSQYQ